MKLKNDKKCSRCKEVKNIDEFSISNQSLDGHQGYCKSCSIEYSRTKRIPNPPKEVTPREVELKEIELLRNENKRLRDRFKILSLFLNDKVIL